MTVEDQLIERFGKQIDLPAYLAHKGYQFAGIQRGDGAASGHTVGIVMRAGEATSKTSPSVLLLARDPDRGGWAYTDLNYPTNRGTIVEYLERHEALTRTASLQRLADCLDRNRRDPEAEHYRECLINKPVPLRRAENEHAVFSQQHRAVLVELSRLGVHTKTVLDHSGPRTTVAAATLDRFSPIYGPADVLRLVEQPSKLWTSRYKATDKQLVLVERGIDAVAHAQKYRNPHVCYVAVGSELTPDRKQQLAHLLAELPRGMTVEAAFGRDERGRRLADDVARAAPQLEIQRTPPSFGTSWSELMQLEARHSRSMERGRAAGVSR